MEAPSLTVITPCAPEHRHRIEQCRASVDAQTEPCMHLVMIDEERRGPGFIRNRLLEKATTPFVTFLDCDDSLEPDFATKMIEAYKPGYWVFCDWWQDDRVIQAPSRPWCAGSWVTVTSLYPTSLIRMVGGFDESLPALEDTDLALKIVTRNICGVRVPYPLMHYRANGGRAAAANKSGLANQIALDLNKIYGGIRMACCGNEETINQGPLGVQQPGDVLAQAIWGGNRSEHGRATGRPYPRMSYPATTWVDPRDVAMAPALWREVRPEPVTPDASELDPIKVEGSGVPAVVGGMVAQGIVISPPDIPAPVAVTPSPDFDKVKKLAKRGRPKKNG